MAIAMPQPFHNTSNSPTTHRCRGAFDGLGTACDPALIRTSCAPSGAQASRDGARLRRVVGTLAPGFRGKPCAQAPEFGLGNPRQLACGLALAQPLAVAFGGIDHTDPHRSYALRPDAEQLRRAARKIDDPAADKWPAIVDPDEYSPPGVERGDLGISGQRQGRVRGADPVGAEAFAVGGLVAGFGPVPRGVADAVV